MDLGLEAAEGSWEVPLSVGVYVLESRLVLVGHSLEVLPEFIRGTLRVTQRTVLETGKLRSQDVFLKQSSTHYFGNRVGQLDHIHSVGCLTISLDH